MRLPTLHEFKVTLGQKHREGHPRMRQLTSNGWLTVVATDSEAVRLYVEDRLDGDYSMIYTPETFKPEFYPDGEQQRVVLTPTQEA